MAKDFSQAEPAPLYSQPPSETPVSAPALNLSGLVRLVFGPKPIDLETPFPRVDADLVAKVMRISAAVRYAAEHQDLKYAPELRTADAGYTGVVAEQAKYLSTLKKGEKAIRSLYQSAAVTPEDHAGRLNYEAGLVNSGHSTIKRFFNFRSNAAEKFIWANRKDEGLQQALATPKATFE